MPTLLVDSRKEIIVKTSQGFSSSLNSLFKYYNIAKGRDSNMASIMSLIFQYYLKSDFNKKVIKFGSIYTSR